ncbi:MAG: hypothetical protein WDA16_00210 [Candidatus Thermoplasmatota archaeon]
MFLAEHVARWNARKSDEGWRLSEHELASRVDPIGAINLGCVKLHFWSARDMPWGKYDERSAYVSILEDPDAVERWRKNSDEVYEADYYLKGHIPNELAIIMTALTRCHFVYRRSLKSSDTPVMMQFSDASLARGPFDGTQVNLKELQPRLERLLAMASKDRSRASRFMLAARFYHLALPLLDEDVDLAYLFLTSSIEPLLYGYNPKNYGVAEANAELAAVLHQKLDAEGFAQVEAAFLQHAPKVRARFVEFIQEYLPESYWDDPTRPTPGAGQMRREDLAMYLKRIYDARSKLVHEGEPLPPQMRFDSETPHGLAVMAGHKKWDRTEMLPHSRTFERMVHHVLMSYVDRHAG